MNNDEYKNSESTLTGPEGKVLQVMSIYNRPVTVGEIAEEMMLPYSLIKQYFMLLEDKGNIVKFSSGAEGKSYYSLTASKDGLDTLLSQKYADIASGLEKQYEETKKENATLKQQIDSLYSNILTLMGIFVAIFALIVINVNAIGTFVATFESSDELFYALIKLNIPLLISIGALVLLIKWLLPSNKNKNK